MLFSDVGATRSLFGVARMPVWLSLAARRSCRNFGASGRIWRLNSRAPLNSVAGGGSRARRLRRGADPSPAANVVGDVALLCQRLRKEAGKLYEASLRLSRRRQALLGYVLAGALKGGVLLAVRATLNLSLADLFFLAFSGKKWRALSCYSCDLHAARFHRFFVLLFLWSRKIGCVIV